MPYITCKDGETYSRYDNSPYVKQCILEEEIENARVYNECTLDPKCKAHRDKVNSTIGIIAIGYFTLFVIFIVYMIYTSSKRLK